MQITREIEQINARQSAQSYAAKNKEKKL